MGSIHNEAPFLRTASNLKCREESYFLKSLPNSGLFSALDGSSLEMRLMNGGHRCSGRIEVKFQGQWGTVCDDNFNINHASVVCKQLKCGSAVSFSGSANFGEGSGPIWFDDLVCNGTESALWNCKHEGWGKHNCDHAEDVGVICLGKD